MKEAANRGGLRLFSATFKFAIYAGLLSGSAGQTVPFDRDVCPCALNVIILGVAPSLLAVQSLDTVFLGKLHCWSPLLAAGAQHSQSPVNAKNCGDTEPTLSVVRRSNRSSSTGFQIRNYTALFRGEEPLCPLQMQQSIPWPGQRGLDPRLVPLFRDTAQSSCRSRRTSHTWLTARCRRGVGRN